MFRQRYIDTRSTLPDKDLIEEEIAPIHHSFAGNQLSPFRTLIGMIRSAGVRGAYSSSVVITDTTDVDLVIPWISSDNSGWEDLDAETMVIGAPGFVHYEQAQGIINTGSLSMLDALAFALAPPDISRSAAHASLYTILDAWIEDRIQTRVQDETREITEYYEKQLTIKDSEIRTLSNELFQIKEVNQQQNRESEQIKNQYKEEITKISEVEKIRYKRRKNSIEFLVVVNRIRGKLSRQLSQIESQLCNEYTDWLFEFEHIGSRTFSQQSRNGYTNLFDRD